MEWFCFFDGFNENWALTSLPEGSFKFATWLTTVGMQFFNYFNYNWALKSLPEWSFDISNITTMGHSFFSYFNYTWSIESLPDSFKLSSAWALGDYWYENAFDSTRYTLNSKVSDLVSWVTVPLEDRDTFSDNQPWRCGVHENWLVTKSNACSISYDNWVWWTWEFKYDADTTWVVVWSGITVPTRSGYVLSWWYTASWENVDEVIFPDMDGQTLYAHWDATLYEITYHLDWWTQVSPKTWYTVEDETFTLVNPTKTNYLFAWWTWSNGDDLETTVTITHWSKYEDLEYYANWYEDFNDDEINDDEESHFDVEFTWWENWTLSGQTIWPEILTWLTIDEAWIIIPEVIPNSGYMFSWRSPEITGWTVITSWLTLTPIYWEDTNENGINDEFETKYKVTVNYVYSRWWEASPSVSGMYLSGIAFNYVSPNVQYYTANSWTVSWTWIEQDQTFTVVYKPNNDKNQNGIADEEETPSGWGSSGWWWGGWWWSSSSSSTGSNTTTGSDNSNNTWNQQTWSGANSSTGTQNDQLTSWTKINEPEVNTGNNIQTWNQVDNSLEDSQSDKHDAENSQLAEQASTNTSEWQTYTPEFQQAYEFAKWHWITTMPTIQKAEMNSSLTRIAMAKMLSQYAINILWKKPKTRVIPKFNDVTEKMDSDYDDWVTLAYQLWIMWQNMPNNRFRPNDEVSRAEFATALSRMLYNTSDWKYKSTSEYYVNHIKKLKEEWIIE